MSGITNWRNYASRCVCKAEPVSTLPSATVPNLSFTPRELEQRYNTRGDYGNVRVRQQAFDHDFTIVPPGFEALDRFEQMDVLETLKTDAAERIQARQKRASEPSPPPPPTAE